MAISDRLNKLTTDITSAYTSIENKGGTIPANKNTDNLHTAIDSIEVIEQATAEGESLSLTNTKAMPYSDYVVEGKSEQDGEPSPSNPSEIHSVADDVNLFDVSNYTITDEGAIGFDVSNFEIGKQYTFSSNLPITDFKISNYSSGYNSVDNYVYNGFTNFTFTMARNSNIPSSETQYLFIALNLTNFITDINDITNYNIKVQKGSTSTSYSPYNQGTVTIKQRGKNLFKIENFQKIGWNIAIKNPLKGLNPEKYTISCVNAYKEGIGMAIAFSNQPFDGIVGNYFTGYNFGDGNKYYNTQTITQEQIDTEYMRIMPSDNGVTQEILENMQIQIEERKHSNHIRTISNTTRLHYTNRTIT